MPLPSSGTISLNQIHVEVGGGSGSQCSLGDSDISSLIGYSTSQQKSFSNYYGASAGPSLKYQVYGTQYTAATTGKQIAPASIRFSSQAAKNMVNFATTSNNAWGLAATEYGIATNGSGAAFGGSGFQFVQNNSQLPYGYSNIDGASHNFNKSHGTGSGQHYIKVYYAGGLIWQSNVQYDWNDSYALSMGHSSITGIIGTRSSASSWRIDYYA